MAGLNGLDLTINPAWLTLLVAGGLAALAPAITNRWYCAERFGLGWGRWALIGLGVFVAFAFAQVGRVNEFIYFQF